MVPTRWCDNFRSDVIYDVFGHTSEVKGMWWSTYARRSSDDRKTDQKLYHGVCSCGSVGGVFSASPPSTLLSSVNGARPGSLQHCLSGGTKARTVRTLRSFLAPVLMIRQQRISESFIPFSSLG